MAANAAARVHVHEGEDDSSTDESDQLAAVASPTTEEAEAGDSYHAHGETTVSDFAKHPKNTLPHLKAEVSATVCEAAAQLLDAA